MLRPSLLSLSLIAPAINAWSYSDGPGRSWTGTGDKPTIICHIDICDSLWSMGVRSDQMIGYFGGDVMDSVTSWNALCHGDHCMQAHFEMMTSVNAEGSRYAVDMV